MARARMPEELGPLDLAWLAGLLEGEGTFLCGPPSAPHVPVIAVQMTDEDVIQHVSQLVGVKPVRLAAAQEQWRDTWVVRLRGKTAVRWMLALRPLMGARRQAQIERALASYVDRSSRVLDDEQAIEALARLAVGASVREVARAFGTSVWTIYDLRSARTHRHLAHLPRKPRTGR